MSEGPSNENADNNVYTVLLIFATALMAGGTIYLAMRSQQLFGDWNPFHGV